MRNQLSQHRTWPILLAAMLLCSGCASSQRYPKQEWQGYPKYDIDPQVIYRIDDHRYLVMDNYPGCDYIRDYSNTWGVPRVFYRDDKLGIVKKLGTSFAYYRGKLIIDAPNGNTIAFPSAPIGVCTLYDKGCSDPGITYSTDAGRTWQWMPIEGMGDGSSFSPSNFEKYTITVTNDAIYVGKGSGLDTERKPIGKNISYQRTPKGFPDNGIEFGLHDIKGRTPSGMERLVCDPTVKPRGVTYHKISPVEYFKLP